MTTSTLISSWRQEAVVRSANDVASKHLDTIDFDHLRRELNWYLYGLINESGNNVIQSRRAEGPEDIHILLHALETLKRYKHRIRAIGLDMANYHNNAKKLLDTIEKTLAIKVEFQELKTADLRKTAVKLVCAELTDFMDKAESIIDMSKAVAAEYNDAFNSLDLEFKMLNLMSYQRGLNPAPGTNGTKNF